MNSITVHSDASSASSSPERVVTNRTKQSKPLIKNTPDDSLKLNDANTHNPKKNQYKVRQQKAGEFIKELKNARYENGNTIRKLNERADTMKVEFDDMKTEFDDMKHNVTMLEDERSSLVEDITTERITNDELSEQLIEAKSSRQNYKENYKHLKVENVEIKDGLSKCNAELEQCKAEVTKWQLQAASERKKRKLADAELMKKRNADSWSHQGKSAKAKELWKKQTGNMLHEFASIYSKWLQNYQNNVLDDELELPTPSTKKPKLCYPDSPDSR